MQIRVLSLIKRFYIGGAFGVLLFGLAACGSPTTASDTTGAPVAPSASSAPAASPAIPTRIALPSIAAVTPNAAQQQAMQQPDTLAQLWTDLLQQERYAEIEPLLSDSLRQAFLVQPPGNIAEYYRQQAQQYGALTGAKVLETRTPYDSDAIVAIDVDLVYAKQTLPNELDVIRTEQGWKIDNFGPRKPQVLPSITVTDELRATLQDPEQVVRWYADRLMEEQYSQLAPIFTYYARSTYGPNGLEAQYRNEAQQLGKLRSYNMLGAKTLPDNFVEVNIDLYYEQTTLQSKIVLNKTPQGWKINHTVPRQ